MIKVKYTPKGVLIKGPITIIDDPKKLQDLIDKLQEAKVSLVEHLERSAEEGQNEIWESV